MHKEFTALKLIQSDQNKNFKEKLQLFQQQLTKKYKMNCLFSFIVIIIFLGNFDFQKTKNTNVLIFFDIWMVTLLISFLLQTYYFYQIFQKTNQNQIIIALWKFMFQIQDEDVELQDLTNIDQLDSQQDQMEIDDETLFIEIILKLDKNLSYLQFFIQILKYLITCTSLILLIVAKHQQIELEFDEVLLLIFYLVFSLKSNIELIKKFSVFPALVLLFPIIITFYGIRKVYLILKVKELKQKIIDQQKQVDNNSNCFMHICQICSKYIHSNELIIQLKCNQKHQFHSDCLQIHIQSSLKCPVCNLSIKL